VAIREAELINKERGLLSAQVVSVATGDGDRAPVVSEDNLR
jgi:phosphopantothenate synthetase